MDEGLDLLVLLCSRRLPADGSFCLADLLTVLVLGGVC